MTNKELQEYLAEYPDNMTIKFIADPSFFIKNKRVYDFNEDAIIVSSPTSFVDETAPEEEWDCEDGKIRLGDGEQYLLFNPIIL
jgi:hypothetical protein